MKYCITLAYDGTGYFGWQEQLDLITIQSVLNDALERFDGAPVTVYAAGRTDAGAHAEGQVISFALNREWRGEELRRALNSNLPRDIRVINAAPTTDDFHARACAKNKTYRYQVFAAEVMSPFLSRYAWHFPYQLDVQRLSEEINGFTGEHDFTAFTTADCTTKTHVRTVTASCVEREGALLKLYFSGNGFLRYQVRTMVAALIELNRGRLKASSIAELIASRNRMLIGRPAPACGLTLMKVEY